MRSSADLLGLFLLASSLLGWVLGQQAWGARHDGLGLAYFVLGLLGAWGGARLRTARRSAR